MFSAISNVGRNVGDVVRWYVFKPVNLDASWHDNCCALTTPRAARPPAHNVLRARINIGFMTVNATPPCRANRRTAPLTITRNLRLAASSRKPRTIALLPSLHIRALPRDATPATARHISRIYALIISGARYTLAHFALTLRARQHAVNSMFLSWHHQRHRALTRACHDIAPATYLRSFATTYRARKIAHLYLFCRGRYRGNISGGAHALFNVTLLMAIAQRGISAHQHV